MLDFALTPFMLFFNKFNFPLQETHHWHTYNIDKNKIKKGTLIYAQKSNAKYGHSAKLGLYHMPVFGGLDRYVVLEAQGFKDFWYVGWSGGDARAQIHRLPIKDSQIKLLTPIRGSYEAIGFDKDGKQLKLKIVGYGKIGDGKFSGIRLF